MKGPMRLTALAVVCVLLIPQLGIALSPEEREDARKQCIAKYTAVGVVGGGILGAIIGRGKIGGAAIGAAAGGALAFALAWGHCLSLYSDLTSSPVEDQEETARRTRYVSEQGNVVRIESFSLAPGMVPPGGKVQIDGSYYVMAPEGTREVKVKETRTVSYYDSSENRWKELGSVDQEVTSALGTRKAEGSFDLPPDVPEGRYRIALNVSTEGKSDMVEKEIVVRKTASLFNLFEYRLASAEGVWRE